MQSHGTGMMMTTTITTAAATTAPVITAITATINLHTEKPEDFVLRFFSLSGLGGGAHFAGSRNFAIVSLACFRLAAGSCLPAFSSSPAYSK